MAFFQWIVVVIAGVTGGTVVAKKGGSPPLTTSKAFWQILFAGAIEMVAMELAMLGDNLFPSHELLAITSAGIVASLTLAVICWFNNRHRRKPGPSGGLNFYKKTPSLI